MRSPCHDPVLKDWVIIGIDCACNPDNVGLACGRWVNKAFTVVDIISGKSVPSIVEQVMSWMDPSRQCLLALDAPLGWPKEMGSVLETHLAGDGISVAPNTFFRRETDRFIHQQLGKTPLDVGADRIARTAHSALRLLSDVRESCGGEVPVCWDPADKLPMSAIEVYPAGTLLSNGAPASGYKKKDQNMVRAKILDRLKTEINLPADYALALDNADCLDALVCVFAGMQFCLGQAMAPRDPGDVIKEGWIWVKRPD